MEEKLYQIPEIQIKDLGEDIDDAYMLTLIEPSTALCVPIIIGKAEGRYLAILQESGKTVRPISYHIIHSVCQEFSLNIEKIVVNKFEEGVFYSTIFINDGFSTKTFDSRTSDAVALAIARKPFVPIFVTQTVLEETGVPIEKEDDIVPIQDEESEILEKLAALETLQLKHEAEEEYEKAAEIQAQIDLLKKRLL